MKEHPAQVSNQHSQPQEKYISRLSWRRRKQQRGGVPPVAALTAETFPVSCSAADQTVPTERRCLVYGGRHSPPSAASTSCERQVAGPQAVSRRVSCSGGHSSLPCFSPPFPVLHLSVCFLETRWLSLHHVSKTNAVLLTELCSQRFSDVAELSLVSASLSSSCWKPWSRCTAGLRECTSDRGRGHTQIPRWETRGDLCINPIESASFVLRRIRAK